MLDAKMSRIKRIGKRAFRIALSAMMIFQTLWIPNSALAAGSSFAFRGYGVENITSGSLSYATNGASVSGRNVTISPLAGEGEAIGLVNLNESGSDISKSVDLGGLEIDFSTVSNVTLEGENGVDNDVPTVKILFCSEADIGSVISSVTLSKQDGTVAGNETLSSGAGIPSGTRSIFLSLKGKNITGSNTVTFSDTSLIIRDAGAPSCSANYNQNWTNQDVTVTVTAADSDAGLEGIYINNVRVSETSPYVFTVSANNTSFSAYAMDLAGKKSDVVQGTIDHIDKTTPAAPSSVPLSSSNWTNADVSILMPALFASSGSPERYVYQIGAGSWTDLPEGYAITAEGSTTIRVAVADAAGNRSGYAQATAKIDKSSPLIGNAVITSGSSTAKVDVSATEVGSSGLAKFCYAPGEQTADYFTTGGTSIIGSTFTVSAGGTYTIFASDNAGNTKLKTISVTTAPTFAAVSNITMDEDETRNVPLSIHDAESSLTELTIRVSTTDSSLLKTIKLNQTDSAVSLDITPAANLSGGPATITVEVEDPSGQKVSRSFTVTVRAVNDNPIARNDSGITLSEDGVAEIDVLANDDDTADNDSVSIESAGTAEHGKTLIVLGKIRYTPDENYWGTDSFTYTIQDGNGGTAQATVFVTVEAVNDAPAAADDTALTAEDTAVHIDVLHNDSDIDAKTDPQETISLLSCADGAHGTTQIVDGMIVYTPEANYNGTDTFTYVMQDKAGLTAQASVSVTISPETDAPWFVGLNAEYTIDEDAKNHEIAFEIRDVETAADSLMLQAATLDSEKIDQSGVVLSGLGDGSPAVKLLLTPVANQNGDVNIKLTLGDGFETVEQTIQIHITPVNDAPHAGNDTRTFTEDAEYVDISIASLLANDSDIDGDAVYFDGLANGPSSGVIEQLNDTTLRYTPVKDFDGKTSFTYYISDSTARALATCNLEAIGVNDTPKMSVTQTELNGTEDELVVIPFTISDNESAPADLSVIVASSDDSIVTTDGITIVNKGDGSGSVQIIPQADANGQLTITLTVSDGEAQASDSVLLRLAPAQDAPVAEDDLVYVHFTTSRTFSVLVNDHDVDGDVLSISDAQGTLPGTLRFDADTQTFRYTPAIGENGTSTFTYTITDGTDTASAEVTLDVVSETHAPVITSVDSRYVGEDGTISGITFAVSDEDIGDTAAITIKSGDTTLLPQDADHIQITNLGGGNYSLALTPAADLAGSTPVTITVTDSTGLSDSTSFYLHVIAQNDAPVANNDTLNVNEDGSLLLTLLDNDTDADGDTIWLSSLSSPAHGYIERTGNSYTYHPYDNWSGTENLSYRISDGRASAQASVSITVLPVNDSPVAWDDWREIENTIGTESANINVLANDYDVDSGDVIRTLEIVSGPTYGTATVEADGTITYTRNQISPLGNGADSFVYRIIDRASAQGDYRSDTATVHIGVEFTSSLNTYGKTVTCYEDDAPFAFDLAISNPSNIDYTLSINTTTALGTFEVVDHDTVRFAPAPDQNGYAVITYTVEQVGGGEKDTGSIGLRVYPVNDLPEITSAPASITMDEDTSAGDTFDVLFHDADCANDYLYFYVYTQNGVSTAPIPFMVSYSVTRTEGGAQVTVKSAQNVNGAGEIIVGVSDGMTYTEKKIVLNVLPVDDAPVVSDVEKTIKEDSSVTFASPGSDSEADGDTTKEALDPLHMPQHGTVIINENRTIQYKPNADFFGTDTFNVIVTDQTDAALSSVAAVTITVTPVNDPPELLDLDYYQTTLEDEAKDVTLTVRDVDNDMTGAARYTLTSEDQNLVKNANITISSGEGNQMVVHVVPEPNAYGTVKINVLANDGLLSAKGAFSLKIIPVNDPPEAKDDSKTVDEVVSTGAESTAPKTTTTIDLLANDIDVEDGKPGIVSISSIVNASSVTNIGGGKVLVSADGDFSGTITFTYTVMDRAGATDSADVTLIVNPVNDPPRAKADSLTINEDEAPLIDVLANDSDPEGDTLRIASVGSPANGTAQVNGTKIQYVPDQDFYGKDSFSYTVSDGNGGTASATVSITIKPINDAPTIAKHVSTSGDWKTTEDTPASFNFVVADAESAVSNLIIKITSDDQTLVKNTQISLSTNAAGYKTLHVTPSLNVHGTLGLKIWVSDGLLSTEAVYPLEIISVNDAPMVTAPVLTTKEDTPVSGSAFATDADGDSVTFAAETNPAHGTVTVHEDGTFDYMPGKDYNGIDSFVVRATDGQPENSTGYATVYITVKPDGDPPVAADDSIMIDEDTPSLIPVLSNDKDQDVVYGDVISLLHVSTPAHGKAVIDGSEILYTPNANYNGSDAFTYTITDRDGKTDTASVLVTIRPVNDAPSGGDDTATVLEDHAVAIAATVNDDVDETTNPDAEDVTILSVDTPAHGTATISEDKKTITYTPNENWFSPEGEPETFYYTAKDALNQTGRFAIRVTVTSVNDLPVITPDDLQDVTTLEDTRTNTITFTVSDVETAAGSLAVTATHLNGVLLPAISVTPDSDGKCSFTLLPNLNKVGSAIITVKVTDADGGVDSDTFTLTVTPVNDVPAPGNDSFTVAENATYTADVLANDDVDILADQGNDTLTLLSIATPQYGTATIVGNKLYYVPKADRDTTANYFDVFTYTMKDDSGATCSPTVTVKVTPVNDAPTISTIANVTDMLEDAANGTGDLSFTVSDEEDADDTLAVSIACDNTTLFPLSNITITNPTDDQTGTLRTVKAIPAANQFGDAKITLTVRDAQGLTATSIFHVSVASVNDEPDNGNRSFTVVEDVEKQLDILTGIDPDYATRPGDYTITRIASAASHGTARVAADGKSLYYKTAQDSNEPDSFQYTVHDAYGDADYTFTVSITVTPVNDAPVIHYAGQATYTIFEGTQLDDIPFTVEDVDDVAFSGGAQPVDVLLSAKSSNSILLVNGIHIDTLAGYDRNIDLKPYLKWNGSTRVTITAIDPHGAKATAFFDLIVNNVNDAPVAYDDTFTIQEDAVTSIDVLDNDTDADILTNPDTEWIKIGTVTDNDPNAIIEKSSDGLSVIVTPNANYNGPLNFTYTAIDSNDAVSNTATVNLTVAQVNDAPTAGNDSQTTNEDTPVDIMVLENDSDIDMQSGLNAHYKDESIAVSLTGGTLAAPAHGAITTDGTKITYTPSANYNGSDSFEYFCFDGEARTRANVSVTIKQVNDDPSAVADTVTIDEDSTTGYVDVMANDTDVDLDGTLNQDDALLRSLFNITSATLSDPDAGTVDVKDNKIKFTPALNWNGTAVIHYTLDDGYTATSNTTFTVTVTPVNDLPVFTTPPSNLELLEDGANGSFGIAVDDVETAKSDLVVTVTKTDKASLVALADVTVTKGANGAWTVSVNPKDDQNGTVKIELTVKDGNNAPTTAEFTVVVNAVNDAPIGDDKNVNIPEDAALQTYAKASLTRDVDISTNGDVLTLTISTQAAHGTAGVDASGNVTYVPNANYNGTDSFVYTVKDQLGATDTGTFSITISQVNDAPVAGNDAETTPEDTPIDIMALENDSDIDMQSGLNTHPENESISISLTGGTLAAPAHGTITTNGLKITYTPSANYNGSDSFEYFCFDGDVRTKATVFMTITAVNDAPLAVDKLVAINEDAGTQTYLKASLVSDVDVATNGDVLTLTISTQAAHGTAGIDENGNVTYTPNANYNGTDSFVYTVKDQSGATDTGTFNITIAQVNDAPVAGNNAETTPEDTPIDIMVLENDSDIDMQSGLNTHPENESISVSLTGGGLTAPSHGTIVTDGTKITYTPGANYNGTDLFDYYCTDGENPTKATVLVTITQVNDSPNTVNDYETIDEDSATGFIDVMANDTDVDLDETLNLGSLHLRSKFYLATAWLNDASQGTMQVVDNKIQFTPTANWHGTAKIYYSLKDGYNGGGIGALFVTVNAVNDAPVFDTPPVDLELMEDGVNGSLDIAVNDVETLKNDLIVTVTKTDNASLVALTDVTATKGTNGVWTIAVNPKDNQNGTAKIELTVEDGNEATTTEEFTVVVNAVNDAPVALDKTLELLEDANVETIDKATLVSDVDIETNGDVLTLAITKAASHGTANIDASGNVTYVQGKDYNGTDSFEYTATDKLGATDTGVFSITIAQVNDAPVAGNDAGTTPEDTAIDILVLETDSDIDMQSGLNAHPELESIGVVITGEGLTAPSHGTIVTDGTKITYTPDKDYNGADTFDYYCSDGDQKTKATVSVIIRQVNDNPVANPDSTTTEEDTPVSYDVLANDTDVDTIGSLNENALHDKAELSIDSCYLYGGDNGSVKANGNSIEYSPTQDFRGTQIIKYVLSDGHGGTATGTLTILVDSVNDAPVANPDSMSAAEDHTASTNVLENDTDVDAGDTKTFIGFLEPTSGLPGTITTDENGNVSFAPDANYNGSFELTYQVRDAAGLIDTAKLSVTITPVNDAPVADNGSATTNEDNEKQIDVTSLIGDVDIATNDDSILVSINPGGEPAHGSASVSGNVISYTPDADFNGTDEITYTVTDSKGESDTGTISITVNAVNDAPVAKNDANITNEDTFVEIFALLNDDDVDTDDTLNLSPDDAPVILSVTDGEHGTATTDGQSIEYTPDDNFNGVDTISYILSDGQLTDGASVTITIKQVNDAIEAVNDAEETTDEDAVTIDVLGNDTDVDTTASLNEDALHLRESFRITEIGTPENGTAELASGKIVYTPDDRFSGSDSFSYTVSDGHGSSDTANVTVTVLSVNDAPVIIAVSSPKEGDRAGTGSTVTVEWTGFDIDGDALTYRLEYFDGKDWILVSNDLTNTKYDFAIPDSLASTDGLKFRVNVRDSEFTSDYGYSGAMKVDKDAPTGTIVTMRTADGKLYTAGTWTNQTVTVLASSAVDASKVTYYYEMDTTTSLPSGDPVVKASALATDAINRAAVAAPAPVSGAIASATGMDVVSGVHTVHITAVDEYGNTTYVGAYLARVDKQQPAVPVFRESISGASVLLSLILQADPGSSGNNMLTLPDGTIVRASGTPTYAAAKNGTYNFMLTDVAGNRRSFSYTVSSADVSKPVITINSGAYRIGSTTQDAISAALSFTDAESDIVSRGYQITSSSTFSGAYKAYEGALSLRDPGTYYIHAYAKNAFGLTANETFGPFIIEAVKAPVDAPTPTPAPPTGDVVIDKEDVEEIPGDNVKIRLPGKEWSETLTLEDVTPGTYLIEAMDENGNIRTVEVRVTMRDIIARSLRSAGDKIAPAAIAAIAIMALALILLLWAAGHNITVVVRGKRGNSEQKMRTLRRIMARKKELVIRLDDKQLAGGDYCDLKIAKTLSKSMRNNVVVVTMRGEVVLREQIPQDFNESFQRTIQIGH